MLPTRLDKRLQPAVAPKIEQLNMRLPEYGTDMHRNA
jgi:hypothetical protein